MAKILAIDDNEDNLVILKAILIKSFPQAEYITALSGKKGIEICLSQKPDVILLDIVLPGMDGYEVCRILKANKSTKIIPIVMMTAALTDKESRIKALDCGADAFLANPIDESELTAQIRAMLRIKESEDLKLDEKDRLIRQVEERTEALRKELDERKRAEEALKESENKFRTMVDFLPDPVVIHTNGEIVFANAAALKTVGADSFEQLAERPLMEYVHTDFRAKSLDRIKKIYFTGQPSNFSEEKFYTLKNEVIDVEVIGIPIIFMGKPAIQTIIRDITDRKRAEEKLIRSEEKYRMFIDLAADAFFHGDKVGNFIDVNNSAVELTGYSRGELLTMNMKDLFSPASNLSMPLNYKLLDIGEPINAERELMRKDAQTVLVDMNSKKLPDGTYQSFIRNITDRKQAKEALKNALSLTDATLESIHNGILVVDSEGAVIKASKRFAEMWRIPENVLALGDDNTLLNYILEQLADPDGFIAKVSEVYHNPEIETFDLIHFKDGRIFEHISKPVYQGGKSKARVWSFLDITERKQAEGLLRESEYFFKESQRAAFVGSYKFDLKADLWTSSEVLDQIFGIDKSYNRNLQGWLDIAHPDDREMMINYFSIEVVAKRQPFNKEYRIISRSDNEIRWVLGLGKLNFDAEDNIIEMIGTIQDITDRKRAEELMRETNEFNNSLLKTIPLGMDIVDEQGNILFQSENMETAFSKKAIGGKCWDLYRDDKSQCDGCPLKAGIEIGKTAIYESSGVMGGRIFSISHTGMMFRGKKAILEIFQDITERKKSEQALQESVQLFQGLFNASPDAIVLIDPHQPGILWPIVDCNEAACLMNGYTREEMIGQSIDLLNGNNGTLEERKSYYNILKRDGIIHTEIAHLHKDGHIFPIETSSSIISIDGHELVLGIDRDITERKLADMALKESEDRYRQFISQVSEGVYRFECDEPIDISLPLEEQVDFIFDHMFIAECNDAFLKMYGIKDQNDMIGKSHLDFLGGRSHPVNREILRNFVKNGYHIENAITEEAGFEGQYLVISNNWLGICENNHLVRMWGTQFDITDKIRAEKVQHVLYAISNATLLASDLTELIEIISNELGKLLDSNNFFIAFYDESTKMLSTLYEKGDRDNINNWPAAKSLTGYIIKTQKSLLATETDIHKLCETGDIEIVGIPSKIWLGVPLSVNKKVIGAIVVQSYDNPEAFNEKDKLMLEFVSHQISISIERKKVEQELNIALTKAKESDRLKSAFLANMSHEIRTPLNSIIGFSELMTDPNFDANQQAEFAKIILNSGNSLLSIISDIMDFSKIEAGQIIVNKFPFVTQTLISKLHREYSVMAQAKGIELRIDPMNPKEDIWITSDENRLRQVLVNLVGNAIKFTKEGYVELGFKSTGDYIQFHVSDTGIGIPEEYHGEIFERFRQVESAYSRNYGGNGLGLAISKSLVEIMGGEIWMESVQRKGSTFYFTIPK